MTEQMAIETIWVEVLHKIVVQSVRDNFGRDNLCPIFFWNNFGRTVWDGKFCPIFSDTILVELFEMASVIWDGRCGKKSLLGPSKLEMAPQSSTSDAPPIPRSQKQKISPLMRPERFLSQQERKDSRSGDTFVLRNLQNGTKFYWL